MGTGNSLNENDPNNPGSSTNQPTVVIDFETGMPITDPQKLRDMAMGRTARSEENEKITTTSKEQLRTTGDNATTGVQDVQTDRSQGPVKTATQNNDNSLIQDNSNSVQGNRLDATIIDMAQRGELSQILKKPETSFTANDQGDLYGQGWGNNTPSGQQQGQINAKDNSHPGQEHDEDTRRQMIAALEHAKNSTTLSALRPETRSAVLDDIKAAEAAILTGAPVDVLAQTLNNLNSDALKPPTKEEEKKADEKQEYYLALAAMATASMLDMNTGNTMLTTDKIQLMPIGGILGPKTPYLG